MEQKWCFSELVYRYQSILYTLYNTKVSSAVVFITKVSQGAHKISVIGNRLWSDIGNQLSAKI